MMCQPSSHLFSPCWMSRTQTVRPTAWQPSCTRKTDANMRSGWLLLLSRAGSTSPMMMTKTPKRTLPSSAPSPAFTTSLPSLLRDWTVAQRCAAGAAVADGAGDGSGEQMTETGAQGDIDKCKGATYKQIKVASGCQALPLPKLSPLSPLLFIECACAQQWHLGLFGFSVLGTCCCGFN